MTKKNILTIILDSVFIVAFNVLFFLNGGIQHVAAVWTAYGFLHFAYLMVLITPLIASKGSTAVLSKTTTYTISLLFFIVELLFAIITFITKTERIKLVILIEIVICAIYVIILVINLLADDSIANKQKRHESENDFIKGISNQIKYIQTLVSDNDAKKKLESLYYLAHSSPSKSGESMKFYENEIVRNISLLEDASNQSKITDILRISGEIERLLNKRTFEARTRN